MSKHKSTSEITTIKSEGSFSGTFIETGEAGEIVVTGYTNSLSEVLSDLYYLPSTHGETTDMLTVSLSSDDTIIQSVSIDVTVKPSTHIPTIGLPGKFTALQNSVDNVFPPTVVTSTILKDDAEVDTILTVTHGSLAVPDTELLDDPDSVVYTENTDGKVSCSLAREGFFNLMDICSQ